MYVTNEVYRRFNRIEDKLFKSLKNIVVQICKEPKKILKNILFQRENRKIARCINAILQKTGIYRYCINLNL